MADEKDKAIEKGQQPHAPAVEDELAVRDIEKVSGGGACGETYALTKDRSS